ncbi:MAG TPA: HAMP domain-containing sensor histidine kinase, partial [Candidatus Acidoferrales bacterium]|nr:HAMP domain-containing sensor histidine kinase [Candidatus Acidoferrales bacterium]
GLYAAEQTGAADDGMRLKEEFLTVLSHELRSPLHSILGNADILAESLEPSPDTFAKESVVRLRAGAFRLLHLIEEMLCFAELRAGRATVVAETVDLQELCENFSSMMTDELGGRPIRFECTVEENVRIVQTDLRKLRLIINALLSNAAKFTHQGFVRLSARRTGQHIEIAVQDSGIGIDARDLGPIFQEFRQLDGSLTRRYDGLGLGLALAQQLAAVLGGRIDVESVPNRGSSFFIRLPSKQLAVVTRVVPPVVQEQALRAAS